MKRGWLAIVLVLGSIPPSRAQQQSALEHVPPDPPQSRVHAMPYGDMAEMMGMDDRRLFGKVMADRLEWQDSGGDSRFAWDASAWYGGDFDKLWIESEGALRGAGTEDSRTELAWDRIVSAWWSLRLGVRHDAGIGPTRDWASFGVAGLAPGFFELEAAVYVGEEGRTALRLAGHKDFLLTQRLVLQPEAELAAYGRDDPERQIDAGVSDLKLGLRLRYEIRREFAPYIGVRWSVAGESDGEFVWLAGVRAWF